MEETSPLLPVADIAPSEPPTNSGDSSKDDILIEFDVNGDSENPMEWPKSYRWMIVGLLAFMSFTVYVQTLDRHPD